MLGFKSDSNTKDIMKTIDEIYKNWCGESHTTNSAHPVHDSSEAQDFAQYYYNEMIGVERNPPQHMVICDLKAENNRLREAIKTVLEWSKFEECYCNKCGHGTPVKDFDYVDELKKAISI